ncbi:MAG: hypothetical protein IKS09_05055 [Lachnospiraceae bacterium]|nr:hypothetical protein [Lachnospiraceae bacterium]
MGKVILCSGVLSGSPFEVPGGRLIYSADELCYYVYENAIKLEEDFFSEALIKWLREKCEMTEIADKLEFLEENNYSFKDRVVALLCSADYYTEDEIILLIKKMNAWENLPLWRKKKLQADELLMEGHFLKARSEYESILAIEGIDDEDAGSVYHNIGVAKMHTVAAGEAARDFYKAYQISGNGESLRSCIIAYLIEGDIGRAENICMREGYGSDLLEKCESEYEKCMDEADMKDDIYVMTRGQRMKHVAEWKKQVRRL